MTRPLKHGSKVRHDVYGAGSVRHAYDPETVAVFFFERNEELVVAECELQRRHRFVAGERRTKSSRQKQYRISMGMFFPSLYTPEPRAHHDCEKCGRCLVANGLGMGVQHSCDGGKRPSAVVRDTFRKAAAPPVLGATDRGDPLSKEPGRRIHGFRESDYRILQRQVGDDAAQWGFQERVPRRPKSRHAAPAWALDSAKLQILYRRLVTGGRGKDRETDARQAMVACYMYYRMGISAGEIGKELGLTRERVDKIVHNVTARGDALFGGSRVRAEEQALVASAGHSERAAAQFNTSLEGPITSFQQDTGISGCV